MVRTEDAGGRVWPWLVFAVAAAAVLGFWVARDPSFLHIAPNLTVRTLALLVGTAGFAALLLRLPGAGVVLLVAAVYLNLSEILVRQHDFPSLLQLVAVPLLLAGLLEHQVRKGAGGDLLQRRVRSGGGGEAPEDEAGSGTAGAGVAGLRHPPQGHLVVLGLLAAHVLAVLLSTTVAADRDLADERLVELAKGFGLTLLLVLLITSRERFRATVWTLLGAGALLGGLALVQAATGDYGNDFGGLARVKHAHIHGNVFEPRVAGPLGDPNYFAQILLVLVPAALYLGWKESSARLRVLALALGGIVAAATFLTYSRGGALALGAVLLVAFLVEGVSARSLAVAAAVALGVLWVLPQDFTHRLATVAQMVPGQENEVLERDSSFQERRLLAGAAWEMFRDRPILGVGAANYTVHFDDYAERVGSEARDYGSGDETRYPHNLYLELGAEGGAVGLVSFLAVVAGVLVLLRRARQRFLASGDPYLAGLAAALGLAVLGHLLSSVFLHGHFLRYLWLLAGLSLALYALAPPSPTERLAHGENH